MLRKILVSLVGLVVVVVLLFSAAFALAQTRLGKNQISGFVEAQLTTENQTAEVQGLGGFLPFDVRLDRFSLADDTGTWLEVDNIQVELDGRRLLAGEFRFDQIGAARVAVHRAPELPERPLTEPRDEPIGLPDPPTLPEQLPRLVVDRLFVDRIELGEALIGEAAVFTLEGQASTLPEGRRADATLQVSRIDQATADFSLALMLDLETEVVNLDLQGQETGGLMAALTGYEAAGDLSLSLVGEGPLTDWRAELALAIENLVSAEATMALAYTETPSIDLRAQVLPVEGTMPPDIEAALGERLDLVLVAGQRAPGHFVLEELNLESGFLTATGQLEALLEEDRLAGQIRVAADDLSRASGLVGQELGGQAELLLDALGTFTEPRFRLTFAGEEIVAEGFAAGAANLEFIADLLAPLDAPFAGARIEGGGEVTDMTLAGEPLRPERTVSLELAAFVPTEGEAVVERLAVRGERIALDGTAQVSMPELAGSASIQGSVPELDELLDALGPDALPEDLRLTGGVDVAADIDFTERFQRIEVDLTAVAERLAGLPMGLDALIGDNPRLAALVVVGENDTYEVPRFELTTAEATLSGSFALGEDQALQGQIDLSPMALANLEGVLGQPIDGQLRRATIQLGGTLPAPTVEAVASIDNLAIADRQFERVGFTAQSAGTLDQPEGNLRLTVEQEGDTLTLASNFALREELIRLDDFRLTGPFTELGGAIEVSRADFLATGNLAGEVGDLAALEPWIGLALTGSVGIEARLDGTAGQQDAQVALAIDDLAGDFGSLRSARVDATVEDAMDRLGVDATISAAGFTQPDPEGIVVEQATIRLTGDRSMYRLDAEAEGDLGGPFSVQAVARADVFNDAQTLFLDQLAGVLQGQRIELVSPATLRLEGGVVDIDQLDLRIGAARIQGNLNLDQPRDRAMATLVIDSLPMAMLAEFVGPPFQGELTGRFDLEGSPSAPVIDGGIRIIGLQLADPDQTAGMPADVTVELALSPAGLVTTARVDGIGDRPILADLSVPMRVSLQPFAIDLPQTSPLDGRMIAQSRLEPLAAVAALDGQRIEGILDLDLRLAGTVGDPVLSGQLDISNGRLADDLTGIILTAIDVTLVGDGDRLEIERFRAQDQAGGRLALVGGIEIDFDNAFPYRFEFTTRDLRVLDSDLGRASVTVDIVSEGSARGGTTSGRIEVPRADLRIPPGGGVQPPVLDVEVRGEPPRPQPAPPPPPGERYAMLLDLEIAMPARVFVRGRGLDTEWGGNLEITGSTSEPVILGSIDYRRGFLDFLDRRFDIREGQLVFTGTTPPTPEVYIEAAATARTMTGIVRVTGPVTDLDFELSSEPELPQDEVLAQLLFDRGTQGLTPIQGVRLAAAVARLEGGGGFDAMEAIRDVTGLDMLDFGQAEFGDDDAETTATAGRYIADNVFIAIDQGLTTGATRGRVEIEVFRNITVRGEVDDQSRSGIGIEWSRDY